MEHLDSWRNKISAENNTTIDRVNKTNGYYTANELYGNKRYRR